MTDMWDTQEGYICQGQILGFVELGTAVVAGEPLTWGTSAANKVVMNAGGAADGDSPAVAMKGGVTGDQIPAVFYGVMKMVAHVTVTVGQIVEACATAGTTITYGQVQPIPNLTTGTAAPVFVGDNGTGTRFKLGMAIQGGAAPGDEILVLIGKTA